MSKKRESLKSQPLPEAANKLLDELLANYKNPEDILGDQGILRQLTKALFERALQTEMTHHLGYEKHAAKGRNSGNSRNGGDSKTIQTESDEFEITVPRDRKSTFEPILVPKGTKRLGKFDDMVISLYARGLTQEQIREHVMEIYGPEVSIDLISAIIDVVNDEVREWQNRKLDDMYPIVYLDALRIKGRSNGHVSSRVIYVAIGVNMEGTKEVLGFWALDSEGAKFWLNILNELKNRGVQDILVACVDGLKGFPEAIQTVYPDAEVQLCIVHLIRSSTRQVAWADKKPVAADLKPVYTAVTRVS